MNFVIKRKYDELVRLIANEIAIEQDNMNNPDYRKPILDEYYRLFNIDFFGNEIMPVAKAISLNLKKTPPVGKWDNEAPKSYKRFEKQRAKLF